MGVLELDQSPLQDQTVFLTTEQSILPLKCFLDASHYNYNKIKPKSSSQPGTCGAHFNPSTQEAKADLS